MTTCTGLIDVIFIYHSRHNSQLKRVANAGMSPERE